MKLIPEWYEHQYCLIAWPCNKDLYGKIINKARDEVATVSYTHLTLPTTPYV